MLNNFWLGGGSEIPQDVQQQVGKVVQEAAPTAGEATQIIEMFKGVASMLYMEVWWLTIVVFFFVWGLRGLLKFVKVDMKTAPKFRVFGIKIELEAGWWPAFKNWLWRGIAVVFSCSVCCFAQYVVPESLPDVPGGWIVLGPTYGGGAVILYHVLDYMGVMAKLEKRGKSSE